MRGEGFRFLKAETRPHPAFLLPPWPSVRKIVSPSQTGCQLLPLLARYHRLLTLLIVIEPSSPWKIKLNIGGKIKVE